MHLSPGSWKQTEKIEFTCGFLLENQGDNECFVNGKNVCIYVQYESMLFDTQMLHKKLYLTFRKN